MIGWGRSRSATYLTHGFKYNHLDLNPDPNPDPCIYIEKNTNMYCVHNINKTRRKLPSYVNRNSVNELHYTMFLLEF